MGRDISIVSSHPSCENSSIRSIINAESIVDTASSKVCFTLKPDKVFLFDKDSEARIEWRQS